MIMLYCISDGNSYIAHCETRVIRNVMCVLVTDNCVLVTLCQGQYVSLVTGNVSKRELCVVVIGIV